MSLTSPVFYTVESVTLPMIKAGLHPVNIFNATEIPQNLMQALK